MSSHLQIRWVRDKNETIVDGLVPEKLKVPTAVDVTYVVKESVKYVVLGFVVVTLVKSISIITINKLS